MRRFLSQFRLHRQQLCGCLSAVAALVATTSVQAQSTRDLYRGNDWQYSRIADGATQRTRAVPQYDHQRYAARPYTTAHPYTAARPYTGDRPYSADHHAIDPYVSPIAHRYATPTAGPRDRRYNNIDTYRPQPECYGGVCTRRQPDVSFVSRYSPSGIYPDVRYTGSPPSYAASTMTVPVPKRYPKRGRYAGLGVLGQRTIYKEGEPIRNFFRAFTP